MSERTDGLNNPSHAPTATPLKRCLVFLLGCIFVATGLVCVAGAVANIDDMKKPAKLLYQSGEGGVDDHGGYYVSGGFGQGLEALFGMLFIGVGTGLAAGGATSNGTILRGVALLLALAWQGVGIGFCCCYCALAPALDAWPYLVVMVYCWLGLIPLALALPGGGLSGRFRSAVCYAMGGGFLGGLAGVVVGGVAGGVAVVVSFPLGRGLMGTDWWLYATMGGGSVVGLAGALLRLYGWEIPSGEGQPALRPVASHSYRSPKEPGRSERALSGPVMNKPRRRLSVKLLCARLGCASVLAALGLYVFGLWLTSTSKGQAIDFSAGTYLFWLFFAGGWLLFGFSRLLTEEAVDDDGGNMDGQEPPYDIADKPLPIGDDLEVLLPSQVGPFARVELRPQGDVHSMPVYAVYRARDAEIFMELGICGSAGSARSALATARRETTAEGDTVILAWSSGTEPSFLKAANPRLGGMFLAWTRGGYYFSAHAKKGEADLEAFLKAFPY